MQTAGDDNRDDRPFQFRLSELFLFVTVFAVMFGILGRFGARGFYERLTAATFAAGIAAAVVSIHFRIKHNLGQ